MADVGRDDMSGMVTKIVECVRNGEVIASYPLSYGKTLGPSAPPSTGALIEEAKKPNQRRFRQTPI